MNRLFYWGEWLFMLGVTLILTCGSSTNAEFIGYISAAVGVFLALGGILTSDNKMI